MKTVDPKQIPTGELHQLLLGAVAPRPIAFVSTIDQAGNVNLSPFSFFNVFSANPPILIFSPARRVRDNTVKHTLQNVQEVPEVAISVVSYEMVQQVSLASTEYAKGVNEFLKSGFTEVASQIIAPPYVAESPVSFECKVREVKPLGEEGGAGNLVICEVEMIHIKESIFTDGAIDPYKLDSVARLGGEWYARVQAGALFQVEKPIGNTGIGIDRLPDHVKSSRVLSGNHLGQLGNVDQIPAPEGPDDETISTIEKGLTKSEVQEKLHRLASDYLNEGNVTKAWKVLMTKY